MQLHFVRTDRQANSVKHKNRKPRMYNISADLKILTGYWFWISKTCPRRLSARISCSKRIQYITSHYASLWLILIFICVYSYRQILQMTAFLQVLCWTHPFIITAMHATCCCRPCFNLIILVTDGGAYRNFTQFSPSVHHFRPLRSKRFLHPILTHSPCLTFRHRASSI